MSNTSPNPAAVVVAPPTAPAGRWVGTMCILGSLFGWSSIPLFLRYFTGLIDGWTANGWRYAVSAVLWMPVLLVGLVRGTLPKGLWRAALVPSILNVLAQIAFGLAPYYVSPGLMTFSLRLQVIFVTVGAAILFVNERRIITSRGFLVGMSLVILGTLLTIALKPGGLYGVLDHTRRHMEPDGPENWRRMDPVLVIKEVQAAGFQLVDYSDIHFTPDDELRYEVGRKSVTGNTDRFTLLFRKPK